MTAFRGFAPVALEFYRGLEADNSRTYWQAHRDTYEQDVRGPMEALLGELTDDFGDAKVFRPNRDVRFSNDKSPYKTHLGAYVPTAPATGWYLELSALGMLTGAGFYHASSDGLAALRDRIDEEGEELAAIVTTLQEDDWRLGGETLKTAPKGWPADHPQIALLRHKSLSVSRRIEDEVVYSAGLVERVRGDWDELRPLVEWVSPVLEGTGEPGRR
ncbi:DUF2461 domain-containing protein [Raineyella sp. LH-20]|uniref:DUF2461 domain-containing protein n=1 Tax=Raineyella sp. LH-20 TaxID=3081204 RepID=UPI0029558940|nr:DUF2461 domain-containing protein [Raineyella sp. LH-20]WOP19151.1 DUF2461 domain-containing protein [Raineyella sp. LH-20]